MCGKGHKHKRSGATTAPPKSTSGAKPLTRIPQTVSASSPSLPKAPVPQTPAPAPTTSTSTSTNPPPNAWGGGNTVAALLESQKAFAEKQKALEADQIDRIARQNEDAIARMVEQSAIVSAVTQEAENGASPYRRRMEALSRLLETPDNVCVAFVEIRGTLHAATNKGALATIKYNEESGLIVDYIDYGLSANFEDSDGIRLLKRGESDVRKVSASVSSGYILATAINNIKIIEHPPVRGTVHAEMKVLNWMVENKIAGVHDIYVSKLCCYFCRKALDYWNKNHGTNITLISLGTHENAYPGWAIPNCFVGRDETRLLNEIAPTRKALSSALNADDNEAIALITRKTSNLTRSRSPSPPPRNAKFSVRPAPRAIVGNGSSPSSSAPSSSASSPSAPLSSAPRGRSRERDGGF
jgi:hypothetical protein